MELSTDYENIYSDSLTDVIISFDSNINIQNIDSRENTIKILCLNNISSIVDLDLYDLVFFNDLNTSKEYDSSKVYYLNSDYTNIIGGLKDFILKKYPSYKDYNN